MTSTDTSVRAVSMPQKARLDRLDPLTGLRGIAAYSVLVAHAIDTAFFYGGVPYFHSFASRLAYFGISLFFVLSGFVIHYNYAQSFARDGLTAACWKFFAARFARLYPLYAVSIIASLPHIPAPNFAGQPDVLLSYVTLTQSWFNVEMAIFAPSWSISTEWFFYFAFILLVPLVRRITRPILSLVLYCAIAAGIVWVLLTLFADPLISFVKQWLFRDHRISADPKGWLIYFAPPVRLLEFIAGMLAAKAYDILRAKGPTLRFTPIVLTPTVLWCLVVIFWAPLTIDPPLNVLLSNVIFAPALALFMLYVCLSAGPYSRVLSSRLLVFTGEISYSVYVWSFFVLNMLRWNFVSSEWSVEAGFNSAVKVAVDIGLTTAFAYGSYLLIESPARRWLRAVLIRQAGP